MNVSVVRDRAVVAFLLAAIAGGALAQQDFPNRPIRFIVPYPAGGSTTYTARLVGQRLTEVWGQQVVIDNRGGGNTIIGTQAAVKARPDGYTILLSGSVVASIHTLHQTPYDGLKDLATVASVASYENLLVVHPAVAASNLQELIALAKSKPGQINYATSSTGGSTHLAAELFNSVAGVKTQQIPYKGGGPAIADLVGGQVQFMMAVPTNVVAHVKANRLRAIAISGDTRIASLPQIPTFAEAGLPGVSLRTWHGVSAPSGTPKTLIDRMSAEIAKLLTVAETKEKLAAQGFEPFYNTAEQTAVLLRADVATFAKIIKDANIKVD
jgi:tripartite-type tricarboxylate transporter receptor subunit TctC